MLNIRGLLHFFMFFLFCLYSYAGISNIEIPKRIDSTENNQIEPDPILPKSRPDNGNEGVYQPVFSHSISKDSYIYGFDISHHQGEIDWDEIALDPKSGYIFLKATEGSNFVDRTYKHNFSEAKRVGLKVGSYHFFRPNISGEIQFRHFISNIDYKKQDLLPIIDVEIHPGRRMSLSTFYKRLDTMLELVTKIIGKRPIIYTGKNFYNKYFANGRYSKYPFMIASYTDEEPILKNEDDYVIWQFTATGVAKGVRGDIDVSRLRGEHTIEEILYR
jgi:lysozyme